MIKKAITVAKWEYLEKVKTKTFIISLIITPLIIISFSIIPTLLSTHEDQRTKPVGIIDETQYYFNQVKNELEKYKLDNGQPNYLVINLYDKSIPPEKSKQIADKNVTENDIDGYILIAGAGNDSITVQYRTMGMGNFADINRIQNAINKIAVKQKLSKMGFKPDLANILQQEIEVEQVRIDESGKERKDNFLVIFFSSFVFILLLMMMVIYSGQMLVRSMLEEKSNRLIEVLISSCTSEELLTGKILGLGSLGLTQMFIWAMIGIALAGGAVIPYSAFDNILPTFAFFLLGFLFYTTLFVGIGSIVSSEQEAQHVTTYLSLSLMFPVVIAIPAIQNPDFLLTKIFSYIPLTIPTVMILRINSSTVSFADILLSALILSLSIIITIKISAKVFRYGILYYGSRPSLKEIGNWLKEK